MTHLISNTDKDFKCVQCGSDQVSIIRESEDPRLKCNNCNFMFNQSQATAAEEAGAIPEPGTKPVPVASDPDPAANPREPLKSSTVMLDQGEGLKKVQKLSIPRSPSYVFIAKDRSHSEFTTEKNLKKTALKWESYDKRYDLFQLTSRKSSVKVDIE